jgi:signal peptidase II
VTESTGTQPAPPVATTSGRTLGRGSRWALFFGLAIGVVVLDQLAKAAVTASLSPGQAIQLIGDYLRIVFGQNSGALFGLFQDNALMFGVVSLAVIALIVVYEARSGSGLYLTVTLGLLLGGAIGNMLDRLRLGYVVDFVDAGIGSTRFYTFNVADSAISLAILLLFIAALKPSLIEGGGASGGDPAIAVVTTPGIAPATKPAGPTEPFHEGVEDPWDDAGDRPADRP